MIKFCVLWRGWIGAATFFMLPTLTEIHWADKVTPQTLKENKKTEEYVLKTEEVYWCRYFLQTRHLDAFLRFFSTRTEAHGLLTRILPSWFRCFCMINGRNGLLNVNLSKRQSEQKKSSCKQKMRSMSGEGWGSTDLK